MKEKQVEKLTLIDQNSLNDRNHGANINTNYQVFNETMHSVERKSSDPKLKSESHP